MNQTGSSSAHVNRTGEIPKEDDGMSIFVSGGVVVLVIGGSMTKIWEFS